MTSAQLNELLTIAQQAVQIDLSSFDTKEEYLSLQEQGQAVTLRLQGLKSVISSMSFQDARQFTIEFIQGV